MLEKRKKVRKIRTILIALISIIMVLGNYIKVQAIDLGNDGKIIKPIYKPEWEKVSSTINIDNTNLTDSTISVKLKGTANKTQTINDDVSINYLSAVTSGLTSEDITVYINGQQANGINKNIDDIEIGDVNCDGVINDADITKIEAYLSGSETLTQQALENADVNLDGNCDTNDKQLISNYIGNPSDNPLPVSARVTFSGFVKAERELGVPFKDWSGNIKIKIAGRGKEESTYNADTLVDNKYGNHSMMETDQEGTNADGTWIDITYSDTETNKNTDGTMFADFIKPEFTYEYSKTTIVGGDTEKVTIVFDVTDKYFKETTLSNENASQITVKVDEYDVTELNNYLDTNNHKQLKKTQHVYYDITQGINYVDLDENGDETGTGIGTKVGERYQLVITGLDQEDGFKYSGYMSLIFDEGTITDESGNESSQTSITIGKDDVDGNPGQDEAGNGVIVDVVDPIWSVDNIGINENPANLKNSTITLQLTAKDKYYANNVFEQARGSNTLEEALKNNILLYIDGQLDGDTNDDGVIGTGETPTITKTLSEATNLEPSGTGVKYTLTLSNWDAEKYSGTALIKIPAGTITDQHTNTSNQQEFFIGHIDFTKPLITKVSSENIDTNSDGNNDSVQIVFKATDKFMVMEDLVTIPDETNPTAPDEITVYIDNEIATGITRTLTSEEITETVNGVTVKGYKYTLILSDLEQTRTSINRDREFFDWSGTVRIDIKAGAVRDTAVTLANGATTGGNINALTSIDGGFADFIKPNVTYEYLTTDIVRNHADKTQRIFTMKFDVTDKYFTSSEFAEKLASKTTYEEKLAVIQEYLTICIDGIDITDVETVTKKIVAIGNVTATMNKTVDGVITTGQTYTIGKSFTLEISGLEQDTSTAIGNDYLNYSGIVTVAFNSGKPLAKDTSENVNNAGTITAPSITSGVNTPDGTGSGVVVDLVDPLWEQSAAAEARPHDRFASLTIKGTDKYFLKDGSNRLYVRKDGDGNPIYDLDESDITITVTSPEGIVTVTGDQASTEGMTLTVTEDTSAVLEYGKQYKIQLTGYTSDAYQVKLTLRDGIIEDQSGNTSQETNFVLFSSLVETASETSLTSEFLSQNKETGDVIPQRQYVEQVIFKDDLEGINDTRWDVSQLNDGTIWAWYTTRTADDGTTLYTVYIGSYIIINGNVNSSYLFANIGNNINCKTTGDTTDNEMIENLHLLHVDGVTNMSHMFEGCGSSKMQSLNLGTSFDTRLVTNMSSMFKNCGNTAMTTFSLGEKFNTSEVTDMSSMFEGCGQNAMTTFGLGTQFNTSKVENMSGMFQNFGQKLETLTLGESFYTSEVTNMGNMFNGAGKSEMTTLTLGNNFNTSKVENMSGMFQDFAQTKMETLSLGDYFYTSAVTDMSNMFNGCGSTAMTSLDLGPAFAYIPSTNTDFATNLGKDGEVKIYTGEGIYSNKNAFKLNTDSTTEIAYTRGQIIPKYAPIWLEKETSYNDLTKELVVKLEGKVNSNYSANTIKTVTNSLSAGSQVTVRVDGEVEANVVTKVVSDTTGTTTPGLETVETTITISDFEEDIRRSGKTVKEWSGDVALQLARKTLLDSYGNGSLAQTDETGTMLPVEVKEDETTRMTTEENTDGVMFTDFIKPEFTYTYSETDINHTNESVKVVFDVVDEYFESTSVSVGEDINGNGSLDEGEDVNGNGILETDNITVKIHNYDTATVQAAISKQLSKTAILVMNKETGVVTTQETNYEIQTTEQKVGERYELIITELDQENAEGIGDGFLYSGPMSIGFVSGAIKDKSDNTSNGTTIAIGINENDGNANEDTIHGTGTIVDVVDPVWELVESSVETGVIKLRAQDKYFNTSTLEEDDITVYVNGNPSTVITKHLTGPEEVENGVEYTLQLGNVTVEGAGYVEFTPTNATDDELILDANGKAKYRLENGGDIKIGLAQGTIEDQYGNTSVETRFDVGVMDKTKPEIYEIQKIQKAPGVDADGDGNVDADANTETIIFNVTDRNFYTPTAEEKLTGITNEIIKDEITLWLDGIQINDITKSSLTYKEIKANIDNTIRTVGHQYTLVLTDIVETQEEFTATGREYREASGTLEVKIQEDAVRDINENTLDTQTTTIKDFIDFIRPEVNYKYTVSSQEVPGDINYGTKTFTMVFEILDKYIKESTLKNELEAATTETEKQEVIEEFLEILIDNEEIDWAKVDKDLTIEEVEADTAFNKTVDNAFVNDNHVIGYKYTLVLSGLEQLQIKSGDKYLDYSGVITTAIDAGIATDTTGNGSVATTITSGIDIVGDVQQSGDGQVVDVVDTLLEKVSSSANAIDPANPTSSTATITFKGTDKFFKESKLTQDNVKDYIKVYAHTGSTPGTDVTEVTNSVNITIDDTDDVEGTVNSVEDVVIGKQYTLTITGFEQTVNQIKIEIQPGMLIDHSGNGNKETEMILYNALRLTNTETNADSSFLGSTDATIERQNIENVTFLSNTTTVPATGWWDVSATGDNSIKAWTETQANGKLKVYIASDDEIFANQDSSYLFSYLGYSEGCTATETVTSLNNLNTSSVKDMSYMFNNFGYRKMTTFNLGTFDTKYVTNMSNMFNGCGQLEMTTFSFGSSFDTSNVTDMSGMFQNFGAEKLTTLDLSVTGLNFNTSKVTNMSNMFNGCGQNAITTFSLGSGFNTSEVENMSGMFQNFAQKLETLTLGDNFYTSEVTNMSNMFNGAGKSEMTTLTLGNNFNTSNVTNMSSMFQDFAQTKMESLSLGDYFYTGAVTDMANMFNGCGSTAMTSLDLGPAFAYISSTNTDFATNLGKDGEVKIYTGEGIYLDKNTFKLNTTDTANTISYTRGTIIPKYRPEWTRTSTTLDTAGKTLTIVLEGQVNSNYSANTIKTVTNELTEGQVEENTTTPINVRVDGIEANVITKTISEKTTGTTKVQAKITLSGFEEEVRQDDKNFLEWSGNIALQLARGTLVDSYGNANLAQTDETGTMQNIELKNEPEGQYYDKNVTTGVMFTDFIKPELTYEYYNTEIEGDTDANTVIDYVNNKITVVFDVTDKYFKETTLATDTTANQITVKIDEDEVNSTVNVTKTLAKKTLDEDKVVGNITYKANGDIYYTINGTSKKIGERYELVVSGLETSNGVGYSGPMTLAFAQGAVDGEGNLIYGMRDQSGNLSDAKTITIGIDEPTNPDHDGNPEGETDHTSGVIVDFVNPTWKYVTSSITRSAENKVGTVTIELKATDKYFKETTLTTNDIHVIIDGVEQTGITKAFVTNDDGTTKIDAVTETDINGDEITGEKYTLLLSGFGDLSGETHIVIDEGTVEDQSGNKNIDTPINVGNTTWTETGDDSSNPRYPAFRNNIVDFIKPIVAYQYSTIEGSENPDIDYEEKIVTVKFTVSDKHLLESDLIETDAEGNPIAKNISIKVDGTTVYENDGDYTTTDIRKVTTRITADVLNSQEIEYTLAVSNIQQNPNNAFDFSGPMQLIFTEGSIDDTSGNKNVATTITLDTDDGDSNINDGIIVDVVDPIIFYNSSSIDRINNTVTLILRAEDKYLTSERLVELKDNVIVKVVKRNGAIVEDRIISVTGDGTISSTDNANSTITKEITRTAKQPQFMTFKIVISDFGEDEGITSVIIPKDMIFDTSGNGNIETEILVGNPSDGTDFGTKSIVDFTKPVWEYEISEIERDFDSEPRRLENGEEISTDADDEDGSANGEVFIEITGTDKYFDETYYTDNAKQLNLSNVKVYIDEVENTEVTKTLVSKEPIKETTLDGTSEYTVGVKYRIKLSNFEDNEGVVKIEVPADTIRDTSINKNILTPIDIGNPYWLETDFDGTDDDNDDTPNMDENLSKTDVKYTAFRNDIVDFIKPEITLDAATIYREDIQELKNRVEITFDVTDTKFLESNIGLGDIKVFVDDDYEMQVYGEGANTETSITAALSQETISNGIRYKLTLSDFELDSRINEEIFLRHSGCIRLIIAEDKVRDTSGNPNNETEITINEFAETDGTDIEIADLIKPIIYYNSKYINWAERYAEITLRATDRFYDTNTQLQPTDLILYEGIGDQDGDGKEDYVELSKFDGKTDITTEQLTDSFGNILGYDFIIRLKGFEDEYKMKIIIPEGYVNGSDEVVGIGDTSGNLNAETEIDVVLDNKKPRWEYVSTDTTLFESNGQITFNVKGVDKFLEMSNSGLNTETPQLKLLLNELDITNKEGIDINVTEVGTNTTERSKSYKIDITGLSEIGTYSLVFEKETLIDEFQNKSAAKTITFSKSAIAYDQNNNNTGNYRMITYHVSPDHETTHNSFVHELMSVNITGTNFENTTFRPSTLGELHNNGANPLFAEPMYNPVVAEDGYTMNYDYAPKSFAGWALADENGNLIYFTDSDYDEVSDVETEYTKVYGLYDEIGYYKDTQINEETGLSEVVDIEVTNLKAIWQEATVVFVSNTIGDNEYDGKLPTTPVKDLITAYSKLNPSGTSENNIIVIMDEIEWNSGSTLSGNATITSLYAGVDYKTTKNAELKVSSNMVVDGDVIFDNIKLYSSSTEVSNGSDYLGNGTYTNMLISNYSGNITLGRRITTPEGKYTFGAVIGGNYKTETSTGTLGTHTIRVESGKYNNIITGSTLTSSTTGIKSITNEIVIGNMRDSAISINDKLTITGYLAIGENEQKCYPNGTTTTAGAADKEYVNVTLYSGTFTGTNRFKKSSEDAVIYLRSINGQADGQMVFNMYGGVVNNNIYGGASGTTYTTGNYNTLNLYGGEVTGNIFGQSANDTFRGDSTITLAGNVYITGNVFGGSNVTTTIDASTIIGTGSSIITMDSTSATIDGNIYGGSKSTTGLVSGTTNITINKGTVTNIYGGGYGCDNTLATNITINNGTIEENIYGGAYQGQARLTSNITVLGGTIEGNIYGGNNNTSTQLENETTSTLQNINIIIGDTDETKEPTINGVIYGSGRYDKVNKVDIKLIECANLITVYGGSDVNTETATIDIYLRGMTVNEIYGGGKSAQTGTQTTANIYLESGTATEVYGGGYSAGIETSNILAEETANIETIYGGSNAGGTVTTSNVTLKSGNVTNVFGGGNSAGVGTANVTLNGMNIEQIHGGSKNSGVTTNTNVVLTSGTVTSVFGGGLDVGVINSNVKHQGTATVTNIYGGNNSGIGDGGDTTTSNINIINSTVANVYGGNKEKGTTRYTNINIQGTSTITGKLYGGGYKSAIGKSDETGSATINIAGGTINNDINGGSEQSIVYGNTNINIGYDATSGLTPANINILGIIYGAGDTLTAGTVTVVGDTHIVMDDNTSYPIQYFTADGKEKPIYGSGNGYAKYSNGTSTDNSTIDIIDFGTAEQPYLFKSIENTGDLYIGKSVVEISGNRDETIGHYYTLNTITNALTIYNNTTLYTQRGFNKVGGYNSYKNRTSTKATMANVNNKIYTLEGINLIFAKEQVNLSNKATLQQSDWGEVTGMTFFAMYKNVRNASTGKIEKQYDLNLFRAGTYVEGQYNSDHNILTDGFYTNKSDGTSQAIDTINYTNYCDWIINAPTINYDVDLIASAYGKKSVAELVLDYKYDTDYSYAAETIYTLNQVSSNALKPDIELVQDLNTITTISNNSNNKFGLTMETAETGWLNKAKTTIYSSGNGSYAGDYEYKSDATTTPGKIKFKLYNSINITEQKDLGNVNIILTGQQPISGNGAEAYTFKVAIAVNLQSIVEELKEEYIPSFTNKPHTELSYTTDSKVDLSYILYKDMATTPYVAGDYRVISTTMQLPEGTRITIKDYGQGDSLNKVYYYHVPDTTPVTETKDGVTRYIYRLSEFIEMGSKDYKYAKIEQNVPYYHTGYVLEKYDVSIDFIDSNINTDKIAQETYLELRDSSGAIKYDNGTEEIIYNLYSGKNAQFTETIKTVVRNESTGNDEVVNLAGRTYSVVENQSIPIMLNASALQQNGIMDTKYYDQIVGMAIQIVGESGVRIKSPELQNFKIKNNDTGIQYSADSNGVIRVPIMEGLGAITDNYTLSMTQYNVSPGVYTAQVRLYTADDGLYYGTDPKIQQTFNIVFINKLAGLAGVEAIDDSRIINKSTGVNLVANNTEGKAVDMTISVGTPTNETNIRVELYKRNTTYTDIADETTYTGTSYTLVDITQYLQPLEGSEDVWRTPAYYGLTAGSSYEYMVSPKQTYVTIPELEEIEFEKAVVNGISTGEYKLVFKAYSGDTLVQTVKKTFIVTP